MKNQIFKLTAIVAIFLGLAVIDARAQAPSKVEVNIPFEFSAGTKTLPAGVYSIKRLSGNYLTLRSSDGKSSVILNAPLNLTSTADKGERLVFMKSGDEYYLSEIWLTADAGRELVKPRRTRNEIRIAVSLIRGT